MTTDPSSSTPFQGGYLPDDVAQCSSRIDGIDRQIVDLLILRFLFSRHIGTLKAQLGAEPFDPERIHHQTTSFVALCTRGGLNETMATSLIRAILDQVVSERLEPRASRT